MTKRTDILPDYIDDDEFDPNFSQFDENDADADDQLDIWTNDYRPSDLWGRYASGSSIFVEPRREAVERILRAHRLLQGVVNTFAPAGERYEVTFDASVQTAATDLRNRKVVISTLPLFDKTLSFDTAGKVLIAMSSHEAAHSRYGKPTAGAVTRKWDDALIPHKLGNLLDDVSIERAFSAEYPGIDDSFSVAIDYVGKAALKRAGEKVVTPKLDEPLAIAVAAVRYPTFADWSDPAVAIERDWYADWATRAAKVYSVTTHVAAIQEALDHIASAAPKPEPQPRTGEGQQDDDQDEQADDSGEGEGSAAGLPGSGHQDGDADQAGETPAAAIRDPRWAIPPRRSVELPICPVEAAQQAARQNGATSPVNDHDAQEAVKDAENLQPIPGSNDRGEVFWSPKKVISGRAELDPTVGEAASAAIRVAFARSKTGHSATERRLRHGTVDDRNLWRIASREKNICRRHHAPSPGNFKVWLLVDCSSSMGGRPIHDATNVSVALARAIRFLPNIALDIWGWTTSSTSGAAFRMVRVWSNGEPVERLGALEKMSMDGTPDEDVVKWAAKAIKKGRRNNEQPLLIVASDGFGGLNSTMIDDIRRSGVAVVSVAIGHITESAQEKVYGRGNYVTWGGSILAAAKPLGQMLGRLAAGVSPR